MREIMFYLIFGFICLVFVVLVESNYAENCREKGGQVIDSMEIGKSKCLMSGGN